MGVKEAEIRPGIEALTAAVEEPVLPGTMAQPPVRPMDPIVADSNRRYFASARMGLSVVGLVAVLLACSGFYAWWSRPAEAAAAKPRPVPPVRSVQNVQRESVQPSRSARRQADLRRILPADPAATVQVTAETQTQTTVDGINHVVLNLAATEKTWLSITSEGKRLFSGFLEPSQTKTLTGVEAARMTVGNAGGIEVRLNGKPIGPIGKSGQVRVVVFTPDNFEVLPLDPPATPTETL